LAIAADQGFARSSESELTTRERITVEISPLHLKLLCLGMFTIEQINDLHARLGSARTLPEYLRALKALGVERYDSYLAQSGIEKWTVDTRRMTMTFYDKAGREMLVEQIS